MLHDTHLLAIEMNPKPCLLSQNIHLFKNCGHLKKIVTFLYSFGHRKHFLPKFQILVVKIGNDPRLISTIQNLQNLLHIVPKNDNIPLSISNGHIFITLLVINELINIVNKLAGVLSKIN